MILALRNGIPHVRYSPWMNSLVNLSYVVTLFCIWEICDLTDGNIRTPMYTCVNNVSEAFPCHRFLLSSDTRGRNTLQK
ncbi:MAG: hypothetical protein Q4A08_07420 [Bacteroidales bacterium]|nr:hypothetical protein [Bacteroidales bacterium]